MSLKFFEAIKSFLSDFESFLTDSLKSVNLPKSVADEREEMMKKLKTLRTEFPQLNVAVREKAPEAVKPQERAAKVESQEIYDAIGDGPEIPEGPRPTSSSNSDVSEVSFALSASELTVTSSMCGNLYRKSGVGKSKVDIKSLFYSAFGKKYCLSNGGVFFSFDKMTSKKPNDSFPLKGYETRVLRDQTSKKEFCFELVCPGKKSYIFAASTADEMEKWVSVLNEEALRGPDARLSSAISHEQNADDSGEEYEDPGDIAPSVRAATKSIGLSSSAPRLLPSKPDEDDEFYDDIAHPAVSPKPSTSTANDDDDGEIYDEAESKTDVTAEDDLLYEPYDDVQVSLNKKPNPPAQETRKNVAPPKPSDDNVPFEKMYYGKWDCKADSDNELAFKQGDIIQVLGQEYDKFGWWVGCFQGAVGLVPREYLTPAYELICG